MHHQFPKCPAIGLAQGSLKLAVGHYLISSGLEELLIFKIGLPWKMILS